MADIKVFIQKSEQDYIQRIATFNSFCLNEITVFGRDLDFKSMTWDITDYVALKARGNKKVKINFSTHESVNDSTPVPIGEPFAAFAKSYIRYIQGFNPTKNVAFRVSALRAVDYALRHYGQYHPAMIDGSVLNYSAQIISEHFAESTAYRVGAQLEMFSQFLDENRFTNVPLHWRSPIKRPIDTVRVGQQFDIERAEKLPSEAALEALPKVFNLATDFKDIIYSSAAAILCSAPDRINEVLLLKAECEVFDKDSTGRDIYGLRWFPGKGAEPMVKWIIPSMVPVVQKAIARIKEITQSARQIAKWYEENPNDLYLPQHLEIFRDQKWLDAVELTKLLWMNCESKTSAIAWCKYNGIDEIKVNGKLYFEFKDVEKKIIQNFPKGFPILSEELAVKYSEALFITRVNELHPRKATFNSNIGAITIDQVNTAFGSRSEYEFESMFDRLDFKEPDGSHIQITSHQFRHYLNTLAQAGGLSQLDIAKWSGRKDISQNDAYNHVTTHEMVALIRKAIGDQSKAIGPLANLPKNMPISRDEYARLKIPTAHTTDFGFCTHDYTMAPCELHADCINCNEHVCVKGDESKAAFVKYRLDEAKDLLKRADVAVAEGYYGANRWSEHHRKTVNRLEQLVSIFDDPLIEIGAVIQLNGIPSVSRMQHAIEDRAAVRRDRRKLVNRNKKSESIGNLKNEN